METMERSLGSLLLCCRDKYHCSALTVAHADEVEYDRLAKCQKSDPEMVPSPWEVENKILAKLLALFDRFKLYCLLDEVRGAICE